MSQALKLVEQDLKQSSTRMDAVSNTRKIHLALLSFTLFLLPLIWTPLSKESFRIPKESIFESTLLFLFYAWVIHALYIGKAKIRITAPFLLFVGYLVINIIQLPNVRNMDYAFRDLFRLGGGILLYFYIMSLIEDPEEIEWIGKVLIHGCILMAVLGILQYHGGARPDGLPIGGWKWVPFELRSLYAEDRPFSTSGNPIVLSEQVILVAPLVLHYFLTAPTWAPRVFYFVLFNILWVSVYTSGTKAAWIGFFLSLTMYSLFYLFINWRRLIPSLNVKAVITALGVLAYGLVVLKMFTGMEMPTGDPVALKIAQDAAIKQHLLIYLAGLVAFGALVCFKWSSTPLKAATLLSLMILSFCFYDLGPNERQAVSYRLRNTTNVGNIVLPPPSEIYPEWTKPVDANAGPIQKVGAKLNSGFAGFMATPSTQQRFMLWRITKMAASEAPFFGVGIGNFCYYFTMKQGTFFEDPEHRHLVSLVQGLARQAHNEVLQILLENGIGGLLIFSLAFLTVFVVGAVSAIRTKNLILVPLFCGLLATVIEGQFQFSFHVSPTTFLILCVAALVDRLSLMNKPLLPVFQFTLPTLNIYALLLIPFLYFAFTIPSFYFWKCELGSVLTRRGENALDMASKYEEARVSALQQVAQAQQAGDQKKIDELNKQAESYLTNRDRSLLEAEKQNFIGLKVEPQNEELWFNLGLVYLRSASYMTDPGQELDRQALYEKARAAYARTNQILDYGVARYNYAISLWSSGEKQRAIDSLKRANFFDPFYARTYELLITYLVDMKNYDEAEIWIEKARNAQPSENDLAKLDNFTSTIQRARSMPAPGVQNLDNPVLQATPGKGPLVLTEGQINQLRNASPTGQ